MSRTDNATKPMRIQKRLLQFNSLPFAYGDLTDESYTSTFKGESQSYTNNAHGSYYPTLGEFGKLETSEFTATISISTREVSREDRVPFFKFIKRQLAQSGKLWAVQNGTDVIWTNARVVSINEVLSFKTETDMLRLSVTFELVDGYWVMASRTRTFLCEYCPGNFQEFDPYYCWDTRDLVGRCDATGKAVCHPCIDALYEPPHIQKCEGQPLCHFPAVYTFHDEKNDDHTPSLVDIFSGTCPNNYHITYDCEREKEYFCFDATWGKKYHLDARGIYNKTTVHFCSKTDLPTDMVRIRLSGNFLSPKVTVNGDSVHIGVGSNGYPPLNSKGILTIGYGTQIRKNENNNYRDPDYGGGEISPNDYLIVRTNTPMFQIMPGDNTITVEGNVKGEDAFIYIDPVEITF